MTIASLTGPRKQSKEPVMYRLTGCQANELQVSSAIQLHPSNTTPVTAPIPPGAESSARPPAHLRTAGGIRPRTGPCHCFLLLQLFPLPQPIPAFPPPPQEG
ncbi:hypothetical protein HPP92_010258 [Vanilla planifolia]|uniref:Uncharacterized protein n=1 Tax=Vanilla planifolia TaxID=51239 RepID=A0A835R4T4_VANPL|nr:hypothetical protein HPP92_010258 [Vanilla planifolia]